jgi:hypothetical protein
LIESSVTTPKPRTQDPTHRTTSDHAQESHYDRILGSPPIARDADSPRR